MTVSELTVAVLVFVLSGIMAFISIRQFAEKGFLFNNAYIWSSEEEREKMDKKPYYRQSAIVFALISAVFLVIGLSIVLQNSKIQLLEIPLIIATFIYAIISSVRIGHAQKDKFESIKEQNSMNGKIENIDGKIVFSHTDGKYELRSHPYEPCLYICKDDEIIKVLHNAFDVYDLPSMFDAGETVRAINGLDFDEDAFCKVLIATINDKRYEMDWTFAASLAE